MDSLILPFDAYGTPSFVLHIIQHNVFPTMHLVHKYALGGFHNE